MKIDAAVDGDEVAGLEGTVVWEGVDDFVVDGDAEGEGEALEALEGGGGVGFFDEVLGEGFEVGAGDAGGDFGVEGLEGGGQNATGLAKVLEEFGGVDGDGAGVDHDWVF